ncbi:MAG: (R)-citramalate synthase [Halobacteriota archaeon]|nr:(R)-citramalate synthase [Halobacteriota archaeon]
MVNFFDTTLRDGEQSPGVSLTSEEKLLIARELDAIGVKVIEAGSPATSEGEREGIKLIAGEGLDAEICVYTRSLIKDIDLALDCDVDSIHLVVPSSDLHIEKKLKKDRATVKKGAIEGLEYARDHGLIVELSGEDASRADLNFLVELYSEGINAGAERICFCDTVGVLTPERATEVFDTLSKLGAPASVHCHDDFGLATANSVAAIKAGASQVHVTVNGIGERSGNTCLEEVVMILEGLYNIDTGIVKEDLYHISKLVSRLTKMEVAPNKSIVGDNAFTHESGIHIHGLSSDTSTYEPMPPETVGRRRRFIFGKHTGGASVKMALKEMDLEATDEQMALILDRVKDMGDKGTRITDTDLQTIAETVLEVINEPKIKLSDLTVVSGKMIMPTASIKLNIDGSDVIEAGTGVGPVDAAINALRKATRNITEVQLEEYHVDAIKGGTDALVEVSVRLSKGDKVISARGAHIDIIMASIEALIQGINSLY